MPEIKLVRRWGSHQPGETVEVDDTMATFLTGTAFGVRPGDEDRNRHGGSGVVHPGTDGPDPRAGGDPSRLRMTDAVKSPREGERAGRVAGAPRASGDVTHVAPENLGKEHKGDKGDVLLASGKSLREDLEEQQAELDKRDAKRKASSEKSEQKASEPKSDEPKSAPKSAPKSEPKADDPKK